VVRHKAGAQIVTTTEAAFTGTILTADGVLCSDLEIVGYRSRRGSGDGVMWRGVFTLPHGIRSPKTGQTLHIRLADRSLISLVVTEVVLQSVCFRARGKMPQT
jgi:hypothetical protein